MKTRSTHLGNSKNMMYGLFRDPHAVLKTQLARRDFAEEMDFAPKQVRDRETGARRYQNFMSGQWAWDQAINN